MSETSPGGRENIVARTQIAHRVANTPAAIFNDTGKVQSTPSPLGESLKGGGKRGSGRGTSTVEEEGVVMFEMRPGLTKSRPPPNLRSDEFARDSTRLKRERRGAGKPLTFAQCQRERAGTENWVRILISFPPPASLTSKYHVLYPVPRAPSPSTPMEVGIPDLGHVSGAPAANTSATMCSTRASAVLVILLQHPPFVHWSPSVGPWCEKITLVPGDMCPAYFLISRLFRRAIRPTPRRYPRAGPPRGYFYH